MDVRTPGILAVGEDDVCVCVWLVVLREVGEM